MKYLWTLFAGFLFGALLALTGLYFNPLTGKLGPLPESDINSFTYTSPVSSELVFVHGNRSRVPSYPAGVTSLWEETINKSALSVVLLRGSDGTSAIASRVSYPSEETDLLRNGVLLTDDWVVSFPGQGSLFINAESNWWPFLKETLIPVWYLGRPWPGPSEFAPTVGPANGVWAFVNGATGRFAGLAGTAAERYSVQAFDELVGPRQAVTEISWRLDEPVDTATTIAEAP
ncbi:MAG: hypothetical protein GWN29_11370 [Gammaproteobacteria bacterium]|nr:hypothetical protein [Gammaproteobacteria bacterium]